MNLVAVIMAGGKGERFWPKSTASFPKQFINLFGDRTMIQHTVDRILPLMPIERVYVVTNIDYKEIVKAQLPELPEENIVIEPVGRNTAPCIGLAAIHVNKKYPNSAMIVLPSDHMITNVVDFQNILLKAAKLAIEKNALVTLGIKPDKPETGYGYIKTGNVEDTDVYKVDSFVEKPDLATAEKYLTSGEYLWNSGMFIWKTEVILECIKILLPSCYHNLQQIERALYTSGYSKVLAEVFPAIDSISIDYGVMEKAENIFVYASDFGWDDVGSWTALERINHLDENNNFIRGNVINIGNKRCIIDGREKTIALIGMEDVIVVDTNEALLICKKEEAQRIKDVLHVLLAK